jgi:sugar phosphate permease
MNSSEKYKVLLMIWMLQFVNYLDRVNLSIAAPTMMKELAIQPALFGFVLAAFSLGYAVAQIPGGALADRFGAKILLIASPILWSVFTGMTGFVASFIALAIVRVLFGLAEGLSNGASFKLIGDYFPSHERSAANGAYLSALALGPAFIAPVAGCATGKSERAGRCARAQCCTALHCQDEGAAFEFLTPGVKTFNRSSRSVGVSTAFRLPSNLPLLVPQRSEPGKQPHASRIASLC